MKWVKLDSKKEPPFETEVMIFSDGKEILKAEYLKEIKTTATGKEYIFIVDGVGETRATHFLILEPPQ